MPFCSVWCAPATDGPIHNTSMGKPVRMLASTVPCQRRVALVSGQKIGSTTDGFLSIWI